MRFVLLSALIISLAGPAQAAPKIDKSCLMVCADAKCEKFVMRCKGDPGYPTPSRITGASRDAVLDPGGGQPGNGQMIFNQQSQGEVPRPVK